jgi:hypothetical protein
VDFKGITKFASQPITYSGTTAEEFVKDFKYLVELHLADLSEWLADSDADITEVFEKYGHKMFADAFSEEFDRKVQLVVGKWVATDEFYRKQVFNLRKQYSKHLQLSEMKEKVKNSLGELDLQLQDYAKKANTTKNTILWSKNLTLEVLKADYEREFQEKLSEK